MTNVEALTAAGIDVRTLDKGETRAVPVESGETLENTVFDIREPGSRVTIYPRGKSWRVENVGFLGYNAADGSHPKYIKPQVDDGAVGKVVHCHFPGAAPKDRGNCIEDGGSCNRNHVGSGVGNAYVSSKTAGDVYFEDCTFEYGADNGLYGSGPLQNNNTAGGNVVIKRCFALNNSVGNFRVANGRIVDSVVVVDGIVPHDNRHNDHHGARGIWNRNGDTTVRNSKIWIGGENDDAPNRLKPLGAAMSTLGGTLTFHDSLVVGRAYESRGGRLKFNNTRRKGPKPEPPSSVPLTPIEAVEYNDGSQTEHRPTVPLSIIGDDSNGRVAYNIRLDGAGGNLDLELLSGDQHGNEEDDAIVSDSEGGVGIVDSGNDGFALGWRDGRSDRITRSDAREHIGFVELKPDKSVDEADRGDPSSVSVLVAGEELPEQQCGTRKYVRIAGNVEGSNEITYRAIVDGHVRSAPEFDVDGTDRIRSIGSGQYEVHGLVVGSGKDSFRYSGEIVSIEADGPLTATRNDGSTVNIYRSDKPTEHLAEVVGTGSGSDYAIEFAEGSVVKKTDEGSASINESDVIEAGPVAVGHVGGGTDAFDFNGSIEKAVLSTPTAADVRVDGDVITKPAKRSDSISDLDQGKLKGLTLGELSSRLQN